MSFLRSSTFQSSLRYSSALCGPKHRACTLSTSCPRWHTSRPQASTADSIAPRYLTKYLHVTSTTSTTSTTLSFSTCLSRRVPFERGRRRIFSTSAVCRHGDLTPPKPGEEYVPYNRLYKFSIIFFSCFCRFSGAIMYPIHKANMLSTDATLHS